jgi:hypothetical protein
MAIWALRVKLDSGDPSPEGWATAWMIEERLERTIDEGMVTRALLILISFLLWPLSLSAVSGVARGYCQTASA